jgi:glucose/arabinose dehydrogenase
VRPVGGERVGLRNEEGYGIRARTLLFVALLAVACVGCAGQTGGTGGEEPRPIEAEEPEATRSAAPGGGATEDPEETGIDRPSSTRVEVSTLATDLQVPWSFAFLPDGDALVTERDSGRLLRVDESGEVREMQTLPEGGVGEGGLLGVAVSPDYEEDRYVYAYTTTQSDNRVVRFRLGEEPEAILTGIPVNSYHDGGRIEFGPDGMLYVTTGDAGDPAISQDRGSLGGKILRVAPDGSIPEDNPFPDSPVYSLGHRNVQGLAWDAGGQLFESEFGQDTWDEANRIEAGENYGWPEVEGEGGTDRGFVDPITVWPTSEASPSGTEILVNGAIPQWEGDLFVTALRGESLWRLELDGRGNVSDRQRLLEGEVGRLRDVAQAPDGSLWVSTSNRDGRGTPAENDDRIFRLSPAEG